MATSQPKGRNKAESEFPLSMRQGIAEVKIYATPFTKGRQLSPQLTVAYYLGNRRIRQRFADPATARSDAQAAAIKLANAEHEHAAVLILREGGERAGGQGEERKVGWLT